MASESKRGYELSVGIDLGTTYSCVAVYRNRNVEIIANELGERTTPSYVAFAGNERLVGKAAKNQAARNFANTVFDAKRLIGRTFSDPNVQRDMQHWPFTVVADGKKPVIQVQYRGETQTFSPEQISSFILMKMKATADAYLGEDIKHAVITVPAYFNDAQKNATKVAGTIAGLKVLRIINEPTAASIAYGLSKEGEQSVLIFDLGGGTFDVSLVQIDNGLFDVKATNGNAHLGGEDFDNRLVEFFVRDFKRRHRVDISENQRALRRLRTQCERAKRVLSTQTETKVSVDALAEGIDYSGVITRARFENLCAQHFQACLRPVRQVLQDAKVSPNQIDEVIMVGGSTRIPKVRSLISQFFGGKALNHSINPDEAVAYGAAVQGALLMGCTDEGIEDFTLFDIQPLSLGIATSEGMMKVVIPRGSDVPCKRQEQFSTSVENQSAVMVTVYEGERPQCAHNHRLGQFVLGSIPPAPRGVPKIIVAFELDANGLLNVSASEESSGQSKQITITNDSGRLSSEEIEKMIEDAAKFKEEDEKLARAVKVKNRLYGFICHIIRALKDEKNKTALEGKDRQTLNKLGHDGIAWYKAHPKSDIEEYTAQLKSMADVAVPILRRVQQSLKKSQSKSNDSSSDMD